MKRTNKKGFTIVELVVVIAVIAILAAVLIPTFAGVIGDANDAAFKADLQAVYTQYASDQAQGNKEPASVIFIKVDDNVYYEVTNGNTDAVEKDDALTESELPVCVNRKITIDGTEKDLVNGRVIEKLGAGAHVDSNKNHECDNCKAALPYADGNSDSKCDWCGKAETAH